MCNPYVGLFACVRFLPVILCFKKRHSGLKPNILKHCTDKCVLLSVYPPYYIYALHKHTHYYILQFAGFYAHYNMYVVTYRHTQLIYFIDHFLKLHSLETSNRNSNHDIHEVGNYFSENLHLFFLDYRRVFIKYSLSNIQGSIL